MKIGLVSALMMDNDLDHQLKQIEYYVAQYSNCDLLCFGESYLQGFEGLSWNYSEDLKRAINVDSIVIKHLKNLACKNSTAISFGFIEECQGALYSSNMVIDVDGKILDLFRRVSIGWKEKIAGNMYKEGVGFHTFQFMGKTFTTAICGDLWHDCFLNEMKNIDADIILWPLYIDFSVKDWDEKDKYDYAERVGGLDAHVLMINSYVNDISRANGGCYVFYQNKIISSLDMGRVGILDFDID